MLFFQFILVITFFIRSTHPILEDDILYDIKWQPELTSPLELGNNYLFTSKRKEKYSCVLPIPDTIDRTLPQTILLSEIEPILEILHSKKLCTYRLDPYWTYELCHGTHIRQYHETKVAGKRTIQQEYYLGYFHVDNQDILINEQQQSIVSIRYQTINRKEIPMLSVRYTHGTNCDINSNKPRETMVLYVCHDKINDGIINFQEVSSCYYEMTVAASELCKIPVFSPTELNRYTIDCYPQENALEKPRNLRKLEREQQLSTQRGGSAQFTMTSADGTTFIISYTYANEADAEAIADKIKADLSDEPTSPTPSENEQPPPPSVDPVHHEFLENFLSGQECLIGGSGWWLYEICYGKHVLQYHDEGQQRTSILLGTWNTEKHIEWITANPQKKPVENIKERQYVSLYYTDGDMCELTKVPRVVEVKLRCSRKQDQSTKPTMYLVEPQTCAYVLGVESPVFCNLIDYKDENGIPDQEKLFKRVEEQ